MKSSSSRRLVARRVLFVVLLAAIAIIVVFAVTQKTDWKVPEDAKQRENPLRPSAVALKSARDIYVNKCAQCHGDSGKGDGSEALRYDPAPADLTDPRRMSAVTDGEMFYKISQGRRPMPAFKKRLTEEQRWQLVQLLRSFANPPASHIKADRESTPSAEKTQDRSQ
jgi:mono/diheme cytochrome c family protein